MKQFTKKLSTVGLVVGVVTLAFGSTASAHVTVRPGEATTASYQTFTVSVPNEKNIPTTRVGLRIPSEIKTITPTQKTGWRIAVEKEGTGEDAVVSSVTWSGGSIGAGLRDEFTFSAKTPDAATELQWKAYQTYADGTVVSWDSDSEGGHGSEAGNTGPFSVTHVVAETAQDKALKNADQAAATAQTTANRSLYVGIAAIIVGLIGIFLATRKQQG